MKKFKMKVVVQGKERPGDQPTTHQFSSALYDDVETIIPDLISFLRDIQKQGGSSVPIEELSPVELPTFELPHFKRLISPASSDAAVDVVEPVLEQSPAEVLQTHEEPSMASESVQPIEVADAPAANVFVVDENRAEDEDTSPVAIDTEPTTSTSAGFSVPNDEFDDDQDKDFDF